MTATMHRLVSKAPTAEITNRVTDFTEIVGLHAPWAHEVTAFRVTFVTCTSVDAELTYGRQGTMRLIFYRYRPSADDPDIGDQLTVTPGRGEEVLIAQQHRVTPTGYDDTGTAILEDVPNTIRMGATSYDGDRLLQLMHAVHEMLVPPALIAD